MPGHVASPGVRGGFHGSDAQRAHVEAMRGMPKWRGRNGLTRLGTRHLRTNAEFFRFFGGGKQVGIEACGKGVFFFYSPRSGRSVAESAPASMPVQDVAVRSHLGPLGDGRNMVVFRMSGGETCSFIFQAQCSEGTETTRRGGHKNNAVRVVLAIDVQCLFTSALSYSQHFLTFQKARIVCSGPWIR